MASVTREEFKIRSELEVVHIPTGAVGSETTSCAARWHDDALAKTDAWQGGPIRRLIEAELKAKR